MTNRNPGKSFVDLEIRIFPRAEDNYPVQITLGEQQQFTRGYLPSASLPWKETDPRRVDKTKPKPLLAEVGQKLFEALFADSKLRAAWAKAHEQASQRRIRLRIDDSAPELHALPWEWLREDRILLSANAATPFSRYLPVGLPWSWPVEDRPIRVLVVISNPVDLEDIYNLKHLDASKERSSLEIVNESLDPDEIRIDFLDEPVTLDRLGKALDERYHILHYVGHGAFSRMQKQSTLYLQDAEGRTKIVTDDELVSSLMRSRVPPRLIFLGGCQTATRSTANAFLALGPSLLSAGVPAVVATQEFISAPMAQRLNGSFYGCLVKHGTVDLAMNEVRNHLVNARYLDAAMPVLFMWLKSGQLFAAGPVPVPRAQDKDKVVEDTKDSALAAALARRFQDAAANVRKLWRLANHLRELRTTFTLCTNVVEEAGLNVNALDISYLNWSWNHTRQEPLSKLQNFAKYQCGPDTTDWFPLLIEKATEIDDNLASVHKGALAKNIKLFEESLVEAESQVRQQLDQAITDLVNLSNQALGQFSWLRE